jgi:hypothetical protein
MSIGCAGRRRRHGTERVDITSESVRQHQSNRFSPLGALLYVQMATHYVQQPSPYTWELMERYAKYKPESALASGQDPYYEARNAFADALTAGVASAYAQRLYGASHRVLTTKIFHLGFLCTALWTLGWKTRITGVLALIIRASVLASALSAVSFLIAV